MLWTIDTTRFSLPYMLDIYNKWYTLSWFVWSSIVFTWFPTCAVNSLCFAVFHTVNASTYLSLLCCCDLWNRVTFNDYQHKQWNIDISRSLLPFTTTDFPNNWTGIILPCFILVDVYITENRENRIIRHRRHRGNNLWCHQWRQSWHYDKYRFSVIYLALYLLMWLWHMRCRVGNG